MQTIAVRHLRGSVFVIKCPEGSEDWVQTNGDGFVYLNVRCVIPAEDVVVLQ